MLIDWFTVVAQVVNFLVLVWLLKKFLYARVLRAIETRESKIAKDLTDAAAKEKEAAQQLSRYQAKTREIEQQRESMLAQAKADAEKVRSGLLDSTREQVRQLDARWRADLDRERDAFLRDVRRRAAAQILTIARRTVADLSGMELQECAVRVFLEKLSALGRAEWGRVAHGEVFVRSAMDLPENTQARIRETIEERAESRVDIRFERDAALGFGLELRGNGWRLGWNSESYLESLEADVARVLEPGSTTKPEAA